MVPLVVPMKNSKIGGVDITTHEEIEGGGTMSKVKDHDENFFSIISSLR
jgi:hypothetical protein